MHFSRVNLPACRDHLLSFCLLLSPSDATHQPNQQPWTRSHHTCCHPLSLPQMLISTKRMFQLKTQHPTTDPRTSFGNDVFRPINKETKQDANALSNVCISNKHNGEMHSKHTNYALTSLKLSSAQIIINVHKLSFLSVDSVVTRQVYN